MFQSVTNTDSIIDVHVFVQVLLMIVLPIQMSVNILAITLTVLSTVLVSLVIDWLVMAEHVMVNFIGCDSTIILVFRN